MKERSKYDLKSGMHKEIRRGDAARALSFARELVRMNGKENLIRNYVKNIVLEETRNTKLWTSRPSDLTTEEWVVALASSKKKWESTIRRGLFDHKVNSFVEAQKLGPYKTIKEIEKAMMDFKKIDAFYTSMFRVYIQWSERQLRALDRALKKRLVEEAWNLPSWVSKVGNRKLDTYAVMLLGETLCGAWSEKCNKITDVKIPKLSKKEIQLELPNYVYDVHTRVGKARLAKVWKEIQPGKPMPAGVDMRWTGSVLGVLWRTKSFEQHGEAYKKAAWEDVKISNALWKNTKIFDSWWYPSWYEIAEPSIWNEYA